MSGRSNVAITISAKDQASGTLDSLNKRLARLSAPADRLNRALSKFGDVSGINRVSEGVGSLARTATDAFRSLDQAGGAMTAITGAASIAGVVQLTRRWADLGSTLKYTGMRLNMPVEQLSALEGAGRRFGSTVGQVDQSVSGLRNSLYGAVYRGENRSFWQGIGIDPGTPGHVLDTGKAMDLLADKIAATKDAHTKLRIMQGAGQDPSLLPLYNLGSAGMHKELQRQAGLGATVTQKMADDAQKAKQSYEDLSSAIGGVANRLGNELGNTLSPYLESAAKWIGANQGVADSYAKVGTEIGVASAALLGIGKLFGWSMLGKLGLPVAGGAVANAALTAADPKDRAGSWIDRNIPGASWADDWTSRHIGLGRSYAQQGLRTGASPTVPNHLLDNLSNSKLGKLLARGEAGGADYNAVNRGAAGGYASGMENLVNMTVAQVQAAQKDHRFNAAGRYQVIGPTLDKAVANLGLTGQEKFDKATQDRIFEQYLIGSKRPEIGDYITGKSNDRHAALLGMSKEWASVADPDTGRSFYGGVANNKASISMADAGSALDDARGHVHVTVELKGAPPGTTARTTTSGPVTSPPPRIAMPMPMVN